MYVPNYRTVLSLPEVLQIPRPHTSEIVCFVCVCVWCLFLCAKRSLCNGAYGVSPWTDSGTGMTYYIVLVVSAIVWDIISELQMTSWLLYTRYCSISLLGSSTPVLNVEALNVGGRGSQQSIAIHACVCDVRRIHNCKHKSNCTSLVVSVLVFQYLLAAAVAVAEAEAVP